MQQAGGNGRRLWCQRLRDGGYGITGAPAHHSGHGDATAETVSAPRCESGAYHCYANQTLKGEVATGAHMDPQVNYTTMPTAWYMKHQAEALTDFLPCLKASNSCVSGRASPI